MQATAIAHPNVALIKYWGKQDVATNLPAVGSLSLTLDGLTTRTSISFDPEFVRDEVIINGLPDEQAPAKGCALPRHAASVCRRNRQGAGHYGE